MKFNPCLVSILSTAILRPKKPCFHPFGILTTQKEICGTRRVRFTFGDKLGCKARRGIWLLSVRLEVLKTFGLSELSDASNNILITGMEYIKHDWFQPTSSLYTYPENLNRCKAAFAAVQGLVYQLLWDKLKRYSLAYFYSRDRCSHQLSMN